MKNLSIITALTFIMMTNPLYSQQNIEYPQTKKGDQIDYYYGKKIPDPYRWLEDDRSPETEEWVKLQNSVTHEYLEQIPFRSAIEKRLKELWDFPKMSTPFIEGNRYFYFKNSGMQNQSVLYYSNDPQAEGTVLLDPNTLSKEGTTALSNLAVSSDGKYLAYALAHGGSDWNEIRVRNIETGEDLNNDILSWVKFSGIAWLEDGFYYSRYDAPKEGDELTQANEFHKVYFHKIGTPQEEDQLIYENKEFPNRNYSASVTENKRYLLIYESESTSGNALFCKDLQSNKPFIKIVTEHSSDYWVIDEHDESLLIMTNNNAPRYKLISVDPLNPEKKNWETLIPEQKQVLKSVDLAGNKMVLSYMQDAASKLYVHNMQGEFEKEIPFPSLGSLGTFNGKKGKNEAFFSFTSFTYPTSIFSYSVETGEIQEFWKPEIKFEPDNYVTKQIFYKSKDGTRVPMFIVHKKGIELNGNNPCYLYGYGGFNISLTPSFSVQRLILLENGGIFAMPNIRGGGEYGEEWHKAGTKLQKQNVFDDFIAAAEYLISNKYTSSNKLGIAGGSNGGLLVGACMTQRPELFKVALPAVGVLDMLRYHKFTIGWAWKGDYGSSEKQEEFEYLLNYSPLHNIKKNTIYPATMVTTADHDDRVVPAHSFKFIATLQEKNMNSKNPLLIRIETQAGHGAGKPTQKIIEEITDIWSFFFFNTEHKVIY